MVERSFVDMGCEILHPYRFPDRLMMEPPVLNYPSSRMGSSAVVATAVSAATAGAEIVVVAALHS